MMILMTKLTLAMLWDTFDIISDISYSCCYDEIVVPKFYKDHPIYDECQDDLEQISTSALMEFFKQL